MAIERKKLTVTIKKELFSKIDSVIDGRKIRNRSHATEFLIEEGLGHNKVKTAIILAGGKGTRLRPITYEVPKPLIPVKNKPLIQHTIEMLKKYHIETIYLSLGYKAKQIKDYFKDGSNFGINIKYLIEKKPLGTAGPLSLAKKEIDDAFLLIWGDVLAEIDLTDFISFHKEQNTIGTLALTSVEDPSQFGVVNLNGNKITGFFEKPKKEEAPSNLINAGVAIFEPEIFKIIPNRPASIEKEIYPKLVKNNQLSGYAFEGQWFDTGTPESYEKAIKNWQKKKKRAG